jgi:hypothetical protein
MKHLMLRLMSLSLALGPVLVACLGVQNQDAWVPSETTRDIRQGWFHLSGNAEPSFLTYEVIGGRAMFGGDMDLGPVATAGIRPNGVATSDLNRRWTNATVPFVIQTTGSEAVSDSGKKSIEAAIAHWEANTTIRFVAKTSSHNDFIRFVKGDMESVCSSAVGRQGNEQRVRLKKNGDCGKSTLVHEIGHAMGLFHEHQRSDRNAHINLIPGNFDAATCGNFNVNFDIPSDGLDIGAYDFASIMHYAPGSCAKDSTVVFTTIDAPAGVTVGQRTGLSTGDINTIKALYPPKNLMWTQSSANIGGGAEGGDAFGRTVATGDFDGDGFQDLAIGVPDEDIDGQSDAGAVNVIYGSASGLASARDQIWYQNVAGVNGGSETGDHFGAALAVGDFNNDGKDDLAIGIPGEDVGSVGDAGAVNVLLGSSSGLSVTGDRFLSQETEGIAGSPETNDHFGAALTSGDFDNDGRDDLAIGVPDEDMGSTWDAGAVNVIFGASSGLNTARAQFRSQDSSGVLGAVEMGDHFGAALAAGDFDNDGRDDLVIGVPGEDLKNDGDLFDTSDAGAVNVLYGASGGLSSRDQFWAQNSTSIGGGIEGNDHFGAALATGDFNNDGRDDLAIGVPDEDIGSTWDAGAVNVLYGASGGLSASGNQIWDQNSGSIRGEAEMNDHFGASLSAGDFNNDGRDDLAIGVPEEDIGWTSDAGAVNLIFGASGGLSASGNQIWHQDSLGLQNATPEVFAEGGDRFGTSVAAGDFNGDGRVELAVGVPGEDLSGGGDAGAVNVIP